MDFHQWSTYAIGGIAALIAWLCKTVVEQGKDIAAIKYYIERRTKDAATELNTKNPTAREMQELLEKYTHDEPLTDLERRELVNWLRTVARSESSKRGAAMQLLTGLETKQRMNKLTRWWPFSRTRQLEH
jgi:hypothetical protein